DKETGKPVSASPGASARFTGTLEDIVWDDAAVAASPLLELLQATARKNDGRLTMSLMTYGYSRTPGTQGFTFGSLVGTIGPWLRGQPLMFAPSRRFAPNASSPNMPFASASGIGFMDGAVSADGSVLSLDFGNALPMWQEKAAVSGETPDGYRITLQDLGPLRVVVLKQADFFTADDSGLAMAPSATDGDALAPASYEDVGILRDYDMDWLRTTGGIAALAIPEAAQALIGDHPIAILSSLKGGEVIAIRETIGGVWVRADNFVQRVDAAASGWVESSVSVYAMKFGKPYAGAPLSISLMPPTNDAGGSYPDAVKSPQTDIPEINVPASAVSLPS
ncbi:MAG: hypothetical protein K2Q10_11825, partial [Rhodospirillales bacterium]|nr:hypothetical protein [Rhodospirillales bacterium]